LRGKREEDISLRQPFQRSNDVGVRHRLFRFFLWLGAPYKDKMLPVAASEQGVETDWLMDFNWWILIIAFVITNMLLFWFAGKYLYSKDRAPSGNRTTTSWNWLGPSHLRLFSR
jgi:heme/copper-type cytochrome/quinol oxidase subunit 2